MTGLLCGPCSSKTRPWPRRKCCLPPWRAGAIDAARVVTEIPTHSQPASHEPAIRAHPGSKPGATVRGGAAARGLAAAPAAGLRGLHGRGHAAHAAGAPARYQPEVLGMLALPPLLVCALFSIGKRFRDPRRQLYIVLVVGLVMLLGDAGGLEPDRAEPPARAGQRRHPRRHGRAAPHGRRRGETRRAARHRSHASRPRRLRRAGARGQDRGRPAARAAQGLRQDLDDIGLPRLFDPGRLARDTGRWKAA